MMARPAQSEAWSAPARGPRSERQAGRGSSLGSGGASGPWRQADLLADPGSEGGGEEGRHCCGFAAKEGTYLGYLGDRQGSNPTPPRLCLPALSHWDMPFEKCLHFLSGVGQVPATLVESGKRGQEREGKGHSREQGGLEN